MRARCGPSGWTPGTGWFNRRAKKRGGMRVLVVEDEATLRDSLQERLAAAGFTVDVARDGNEGLFAGLEYPLDVAIVDLGLPNLPGLEVIRRLRAARKTFPILILTARDNWQDKVEGLRGRGRLRRQALSLRGGARATAGAAAARGGLGEPAADVRKRIVGYAGAERAGRRRASGAHHVRVPHPRAPHAARRRCDLQDRAHRAAVRPGLRARQQRHRGAGRTAAPPARPAGRAASYRDAARPGLSLRAAARLGVLSHPAPTCTRSAGGCCYRFPRRSRCSSAS